MFEVLPWSLALLAILTLQDAVVLADDTPKDLCGQFDNWNSTNPAEPYFCTDSGTSTVINNAWGDDGSGSSCLNVTNDGASWSVTYKWTGVETLVKGYPHMEVFPSNLPVPLQNVSHLNLKATWSTVVDGTQNADAANQALALHLNAIRSNVAVDMFLSPDAENSTGTSPPIEIMIWPWYSPWVKPLGWQETDPNQHVVMVDGTNFSLYSGYNDGQQHVFSWLAQKNLTSTDADYAPLLKYIWQQNMLPGDLWLGQLAFGTEVLHAADTTVFSMDDYKLELIRQGDKDDYTTTTTTTSSTSATATTSPSSTSSNMPATTTASTTHSAITATSTSGASISKHSASCVWDRLMELSIFMMIVNMI